MSRDELSRELAERLFAHRICLVQALEQSNLGWLKSFLVHHGLHTSCEVSRFIVVVKTCQNVAGVKRNCVR